MEFQSLRANVISLARAIQGSAQNLSDRDVQAVGGMLPLTTDSLDIALHKMKIAESMISSMRDTVLGLRPTLSLKAEIEKAEVLSKKVDTPADYRLIRESKTRDLMGVKKADTLPKGYEEAE